MVETQASGAGANLDAAPEGYRPCAGIALFNRQGQLFLAQRKGFRVEYGWQMPQGGIDAGETPLEGARRELTEETSIPIDAVRLLGAHEAWLTYDFDEHAKLRGKIANKYRGQAQRWFAFELLGDDSLINLDTEEPEFSTWIWTDFATALDRIVPFKRDVYSAVAQAFAGFERR